MIDLGRRMDMPWRGKARRVALCIRILVPRSGYMLAGNSRA
jgi:hypothetical protein